MKCELLALEIMPDHIHIFKRTGCMFCMFGIHLEKKPNRFMLMKKTHPQLYNYCIKKLELGKVLDYIEIDYGKQKELCLCKVMEVKQEAMQSEARHSSQA